MIEYNDPDEPARLTLDDPQLDAALGRVFEDGTLRRTFDELVRKRGLLIEVDGAPGLDQLLNGESVEPDAYGRDQTPFTD